MKKIQIHNFLFLLSVYLLFGCNPTNSSDKEKGQKPNFIVIMADDISAIDFSCYGNETISTPNIDNLAQTGVQFHTAWSTPLCMPSRIQIMTGKYASSTRWYGNSFKPADDTRYGIEGEPGYELSQELFFTKFFRENGYKTAISGKWHVEDYPDWNTFKKDYGFDEYCLWGLPDSLPKGFENYDMVEGASGPYWDIGGRGPFWQPAIIENGKLGPTDEHIYGPDYFTDFVNRFVQENKDEPFLVYYPSNIAHNWWYSPVSEGTGWNTFGPVPEIDSLGNKTGEKTDVGRKPLIEYLDYLVGQIVHNLDSLGIRENTYIIFTTDNGSPGHGKGKLKAEDGFRVPFIINNPSITSKGVKHEYVQLADVFPTIAELAGLTIPDSAKTDGISVKSVLEGNNSERDYLYSYLNWLPAFRYKDYYLDGNDSLWKCVPKSTFKYDYINYSDSIVAPEVLSKFKELKQKFPAPDTTNNPMYERYLTKQKMLESGWYGKKPER
jgi:arylsulfatase A-like enzyme